MRRKLILGFVWGITAAANTAAPSAAAAEREGHGGLGYVCRDAAGVPWSVQMYELSNQVGAPITRDPRLASAPFSVIVELAAARLVHAGTPTLAIYSAFLNVYSTLYSTREELPPGTGIHFDSEAFPTVPTFDRSASCRAEMIAHAEHGRVRLDMDLYSRLDEYNKAALWIHETAYFIAKRISQPPTAEPIRSFTRSMLDVGTERLRAVTLAELWIPKTHAVDLDVGDKEFAAIVGHGHAGTNLAVQVGVGPGTGTHARWDIARIDAVALREVNVTDLRTGVTTRLEPGWRDYPVRADWDEASGARFSFPDRTDRGMTVIELVFGVDVDRYSAWEWTTVSVRGGEGRGGAASGGYSHGSHSFGTEDATGTRRDQTIRVRIVVL